MRRTPPDILITTPESLYLILTSQAREMLRGVESVIVDEIHAVAVDQARRAPRAHARAPVRAQRPTSPQRIGLSATQNPLEEVGRFMVGPRRTVPRSSTRASASRWTSRSTCRSSRWSSPTSRRAPTWTRHPSGGEATRKSIWPAIYPELLELVRAHRSTIVFVNSRRGAERLALRLNELAERGDRRARHHGSLAREERTVVEEMLKAGELPCLVATSSLELGIDMGAVDLVLQVESPKSVARGLQRIGRAGHYVGDTQQGPHLPEVPRRPARVRGRRQAHARGRASSRPSCRATRSTCSPSRSSRSRPRGGRRARAAVVRRRAARARHAHALLRRAVARRCSRTCSTCSTAAIRRRSSASCARASCGTASAGRSARARARASSRSPTRARSPTAACSRSSCPTAAASASSTRRWSTRRAPGRPSCSAPRRGGSRRSAATASSSRRRPASRAPCPSGRATASGARRSSARRSAPSAAGRSTRPAEVLERDYDLDALAARNLLDYLREQQEATRVVPSDRTIVIERFRDEIGDWRLCVLTPVRRARPRRLGPRAVRAASARSTASSPTRSGPTTGSSSTSPTPTSRRAPTSSSSTPTSSRTPSSASSAPARCSARASARTPRARCSSRAPTRASARRCGSSA